MKINKNVTLIILILIVMISISSCTNPLKIKDKSKVLSQSNFQLDTIVKINLYGWEDEAIFNEVFDEIGRLEKILSVDYEGSDLDLLCKNAGTKWTTVSPETLEILKTSIYYSELSEGYFDITAGPLISLWNIKDGKGYVPSSEEIEEAKKFINYKDILFQNEKEVMLKNPGMKANLGAIAKGYIADRVKELLLEKGVKSAIINLGGNILVVGEPPEGGEFNIGVQDPLGETGEAIGILQINDKSLVSSGSYERYFVYEGKKYHHILDPFTGYPSDNNLSGVTVVSEKSTDGDALSTIIFLLGEEKGMKLIESISNTEAVFIDKKGNIQVSTGLQDKLIKN
ncbi:FAD:protein FMN transferase [Anaerovorax odorimutans]|uniref:FAD:protein FMN transferase n=1 Tax=Anaerovorax odorimutans TaxID=109327 RepID=UPI0004177195|nr:FAD:protein FMN transferase [Anaerovorax odorimutans]